jgi:hypothetical protein
MQRLSRSSDKIELVVVVIVPFSFSCWFPIALGRGPTLFCGLGFGVSAAWMFDPLSVPGTLSLSTIFNILLAQIIPDDQPKWHP